MTTHRFVNTPEGFVDPESLAAHTLPTSQVAPEPAITRLHSGPIRITMNAGQVAEESVGVTRHVVGRDDAPATSVAATYRKQGPRDSVQLVPGDESSRTDVRSAERRGLIRFDTSTGRWVDVVATQVEPSSGAQQSPQQAQQQEQQAQDPGAEYFAPEDDATWAQMIDQIPQGAYDSSRDRTMGLIAYGTGSMESVAHALARDGGMEPSRALELVEDGVELHRRAVVKALGKEGMDEARVAQFFESLRSKPAALHEAMQRLAMGRDVGGFVELARAFEVANPSPDAKMLEAMGFEVARDPAAGELVARPKGSKGGWHPVRALIAGLKKS